MKTILIAVVASMFLAACGQDTKGTADRSASSSSHMGAVLDGTYAKENGKHKLTFTSDHKVKSEQLGKPIETNYVVEGKSVKFTFPGGVPMNYTINDDGSLTAPGFDRLVKTD